MIEGLATAIKEVSELAKTKINVMPDFFKNIEYNKNTDINKPLNLPENVSEIRETRPLTDDERKNTKEKTGMSDATLDKCTIDKDGVIHLDCINGDLEGKTNGITDVIFQKKVVDINGVKIEVVVPKFNSLFETRLDERNIRATDAVQNRDCMSKLQQEILRNPELRKQFSEDELKMIEKGRLPKGYTWHHDASYGKMQLVKTDIHSDTRHTGGKTIWGGGQENR